MTPQQLVEIKNKLQTEIQDFEKKLQAIIVQQKNEKNVEKMAALILKYDQTEREIEDRSHVFSLLSEPETELASPFVKSEWYSYIEAAETVSPELVQTVVDRFSPAIRQAIHSQDDDAVDLIQAEYHEYLIPGFILANQADRVDGLVMEMNAACTTLDPAFTPTQSSQVVFHAFQKAINSNVRIEPIAEIVKAGSVKSLTPEQRNTLLDELEERAAVLRFEVARKQTLAMEKALKIFEQK